MSNQVKKAPAAELFEAFGTADDAWQKELVSTFKKQAGDARFDIRGVSTDMLRSLYAEVKRTGDLWRNAVAEARQERHQMGCICADCSGAELTAAND